MAAVGPGLEAAGILIAVVAVPGVFPDGRLLSRPWQWPVRLYLAIAVPAVRGPVVSQPYRRVSVTAAISSSPISGGLAIACAFSTTRGV